MNNIDRVATSLLVKDGNRNRQIRSGQVAAKRDRKKSNLPASASRLYSDCVQSRLRKNLEQSLSVGGTVMYDFSAKGIQLYDKREVIYGDNDLLEKLNELIVDENGADFQNYFKEHGIEDEIGLQGVFFRCIDPNSFQCYKAVSESSDRWVYLPNDYLPAARFRGGKMALTAVFSGMLSPWFFTGERVWSKDFAVVDGIDHTMSRLCCDRSCRDKFMAPFLQIIRG
ncbi:MAG: hypothetical protein FWD33_00715 [Alphaproteobacteria bacterium]|nr:hypothetical protein [Alphaproteobacteria bacterium]